VQKTGITVSIGESKQEAKTHILVTSTGYLKTHLTSRSGKMNLRFVKMVIFDEADDIFNHAEMQMNIKVIVESL
jgi:superfamily II DNA/RNA helicase